MNINQTINSFSARTVDRLISARRATLTMLATFLIAMTAQTAWAQDPATIGSIQYNSTLGAYVINSWRNLWDLAVYVNGSGEYSVTIPNENVSHNCEGKTFIMTADIEFNTTVDNNLTPIGDVNAEFKGTFDGQGHTISGVRIKQTSNQHKGIFGYVSGTVKNIVVSNCKIEGYARVSVIAAGLKSGTINNCHVVGNDVTLMGTDYVGGIVGESNGGTIEGCTCAATITGIINGGNADNMGGIVGKLNSSRLTNNIFTGAINGKFDAQNGYIGAIVGNNGSGNLTNNVYTSTGFGGIGAEGSTTGADGDDAKCAYTIAAGEKLTVDFAGSATTPYGSNGISIYDAGMKYANTLYVDGTAAVSVKLSSEDPVNSYSASAGTLSGTAITGSEDAYTLAMATPASNITITADFALWGEKDGADGSEAKPYIISTTAGLDKLAQRVNAGNDAVVNGFNGKFFKLGADIEYDGTEKNNFTPIGDNNHSFYGTFDGDGKTISGININSSSATYQGIFGFVDGTVKNLVVSSSSIVAYQNIGAIAGCLRGDNNGTIENCRVENNVTLSGHNYVGGIVGQNGGAIKSCASATTIRGTIANEHDNAEILGGIVGKTNSSSKLTDNIFTGTISDNLKEYIGAIVGQNANGTLTHNLYTSTGGGFGAEGSATGADGAGACKAVAISADEGVTITPTGEATTYNVSGITIYENSDYYAIGYDSKLYAGATDAVNLSIAYTVPTGYEFNKIDAGEGVTVTASNDTYTITMPASDVTVDVVYKAIEYTLQYKGIDQANFEKSNPEKYTIETESFMLNNPTKEGYLFTGWTYEGQDEPTKTVTIAKGTTGDKTFTANWKEFVETEVEKTVTNESAKEAEITDVMVPKDETVAIIPATIDGYTVTSIADGSFAGKTDVTDIYLPETDEPINIEAGALKIDDTHVATVHVPLPLLDDYANMPGLKDNFEADKIQAMAKAPNKYWTFSCGVDVKVPDGVKVYTCQLNNDKTAVVINELTDEVLGGVIKANNGVLLSSATGEFPFVVGHASAKEVGKSYENNLLEPVLKATNFASGEYYVLKDNEFHPILSNNSKVPVCKAVLHVPSKSMARLEIIVGDEVKTAIKGIVADEEGAEWYTISGQRIDKPTKKGLYIKNGKKVIIK